MKALFRFPNPVDEASARLVAAGVVVLSVAFLVVQTGWLLVPLAYGFVARVLTGPTLSPLGQVVTRWLSPRLPARLHREVPGPPKRFAQGIGATLTVAAVVAWFSGVTTLASVLVLGVVVAATLESVFAYCLGCTIFYRLMRWGLIPDNACEACNNLAIRTPA